jgi:hypothetical protein
MLTTLQKNLEKYNQEVTKLFKNKFKIEDVSPKNRLVIELTFYHGDEAPFTTINHDISNRSKDGKFIPSLDEALFYIQFYKIVNKVLSDLAYENNSLIIWNKYLNRKFALEIKNYFDVDDTDLYNFIVTQWYTLLTWELSIHNPDEYAYCLYIELFYYDEIGRKFKVEYE